MSFLIRWKREKNVHHENATWYRILTERLGLRKKCTITVHMHIYRLVTTWIHIDSYFQIYICLYIYRLFWQMWQICIPIYLLLLVFLKLMWWMLIFCISLFFSHSIPEEQLHLVFKVRKPFHLPVNLWQHNVKWFIKYILYDYLWNAN